ncbi:MAG: hypothetical protein ABRQ39_22175 [Candidatus Eremiobacterota bacterium]
MSERFNIEDNYGKKILKFILNKFIDPDILDVKEKNTIYNFIEGTRDRYDIINPFLIGMFPHLDIFIQILHDSKIKISLNENSIYAFFCFYICSFCALYAYGLLIDYEFINCTILCAVFELKNIKNSVIISLLLPIFLLVTIIFTHFISRFMYKHFLLNMPLFYFSLFSLLVYCILKIRKSINIIKTLEMP